MRNTINLQDLPELNGLELISTEEELLIFFSKLRQDNYSLAKLAPLKLYERLKMWRLTNKVDVRTFFAVHDEPDNLQKNDNWGRFTLFECVAIRGKDNIVRVFKNKLQEFEH